ncbi:MAG: peptidylprolyl isomerase [Polyangiales bacterium]
MSLLGGGCGERRQKDVQTTETPSEVHGLTPEQAGKPLLRLGQTTVTVGEFAERLASQSPYLRARYNSPERKKEFLDNFIRFELLALEAKRLGFDKHPDVVRTRKQFMVQQMIRREFEEKIKLRDVKSSEIRAYYDKHRGEFHRPAQVRASHLQVGDAAMATQLLGQLQSADDRQQRFEQLVRRHSQDAESKTQLGDLRFFSRPGQGQPDEATVPAAVAKAAFSLKQVGDLYPKPVQSEAGYHLIMLTGKREALNRSLAEVRRAIQTKLWRQKREKAVANYVKSLRRKYKVREYPAHLAQVELKAKHSGDN